MARPPDRALWAVTMTAYVTGTSTRKVDDLVVALGCDTGVSKSTVTRRGRDRSTESWHSSIRAARPLHRLFCVLERHQFRLRVTCTS